jgi:HK97 family phage portal protein
MKFSFLKNKTETSLKPEYKTFFLNNSSPVWYSNSYYNFAQEGYIKNIIAHRCIKLLSEGASFVPFKLFKINNNKKIELKKHPIIKILNNPNKFTSCFEFFESIYSYKLIAGNAYIQAITFKNEIHELKVLRPDQVCVLLNKNDQVCGYRLKEEEKEKDFYFNNLNEKCNILHIKNFHPLNEYYGLSSIECAKYAIDQHNEASNYAKALLQNSARPSGALIVKSTEYNSGGRLNDDQFERLKEQLNEEFTGITNTGKPMLLEGGLDWKEMSVNPKDMDFIENKNSASREIALAFGIPPQLLGIPGDNTYNNMMEARIALWEQTIIPMMTDVFSSLSGWVSRLYEESLILEFNKEAISALAYKREKEWDKISKATFLTDQEKREILGFSSM